MVLGQAQRCNHMAYQEMVHKGIASVEFDKRPCLSLPDCVSWRQKAMEMMVQMGHMETEVSEVEKHMMLLLLLGFAVLQRAFVREGAKAAHKVTLVSAVYDHEALLILEPSDPCPSFGLPLERMDELAEALQEINFGEKERVRAFDLAEETEAVMQDQGRVEVEVVLASFSLQMDFEQEWVMTGDLASSWKRGVMMVENGASLVLSPMVEDYDELWRHGENEGVKVLEPEEKVTSETVLYDEELETPLEKQEVKSV
ncbi:hypothetical protein GOODEAATRI_008634 [Goodea atripinnis]|uniref:Uncharacterized protein n=1 Tax=Goodea atripinnis TaxID=208336 RepID=A0ABV0MI46_9TELE